MAEDSVTSFSRSPRSTSTRGKFADISCLMSLNSFISQLFLLELENSLKQTLIRSTTSLPSPPVRTHCILKMFSSIDYNIPKWFLNRQRDIREGTWSQLISNGVDTKLREDLERMKKIRCHRGLRHHWGYKVRGQKTKSTGRTGRTLGVTKKKWAAWQSGAQLNPRSPVLSVFACVASLFCFKLATTKIFIAFSNPFLYVYLSSFNYLYLYLGPLY